MSRSSSCWLIDIQGDCIQEMYRKWINRKKCKWWGLFRKPLQHEVLTINRNRLPWVCLDNGMFVCTRNQLFHSLRLPVTTLTSLSPLLCANLATTDAWPQVMTIISEAGMIQIDGRTAISWRFWGQCKEVRVFFLAFTFTWIPRTAPAPISRVPLQESCLVN